MSQPDTGLEGVAGRLARAFRRIHGERMRGLPILNPALSVQVVGGRLYRGDWVGVLITPWCMNLVLVPGAEPANRPAGLGLKQMVELPAAAVELIGSEEPDIGPFGACSLYSPMGDFQDQAAAVATAEAILEGLLAPSPEVPEPAGGGTGISRRDLLRGVFRGG